MLDAILLLLDYNCDVFYFTFCWVIGVQPDRVIVDKIPMIESKGIVSIPELTKYFTNFNPLLG